MSGIVKSVGKIFKKVGKIVKKALPYIALAVAIYFTGGAILAALPAVSGALGLGGTAAAAGAAGPIAGSPVITGASGGGFLGSLGSIFGGGSGGGTGVMGLFGSMLGGAAQGLQDRQTAKDENQFKIDEENRLLARYKGAGNAASFNFGNLGAPQGLGVSSLTDPTAVVQNTTGRPPRQSVVDLAEAPLQAPRIQYNQTTGRIQFA